MQRIIVLVYLLFCLTYVHATSPTLTFTTATTFTVAETTKVSGDDFFGVGYSQGFSVNGQTTPRLVLTRGVTYTFINNAAPIHPVYLTSDSTGLGAGTKYMTPISTAGVAGQKTWTADPNGSGTLTLYYMCNLHAKMGNVITVVDPEPTTRPATTSLCDWYTKHGLNADPTVAANEVALLQSVFTRGLVGDATTTPPVEGLLNNALTSPFFTAFASPGTARDTHISHLIAYFGSKDFLGCSASGFPTYTGVTNMRELHANMAITQAVFDAFVEQAHASALSHGVTAGDADLIKGTLQPFLRLGNKLFTTSICNQPDCACKTPWTGPDCTGGVPRPTSVSLCDWYTGQSLLDPAATADEEAVLHSVFTRGLVGDATTTPPVEGLLNNALTSPFFTAFASPGAARDTHISHLIAFFGTASYLGCTAAGFPAYTGATNMRVLHASMGITQAIFDAFVEQAHASSLSHGMTAGDADAVAGSLQPSLRIGNTLYSSSICNQPGCKCATPWTGADCTGGVTRPQQYSICDWYTAQAGLDSTSAVDEIAFLRPIFFRALTGNSTVTPAVEGIFHNALTAPFFSSIASDPNPSRLDTHLLHVMEFFGPALGCSSADFPKNPSTVNQRDLHAGMNITYAAYNAFITQVATSVLSYGMTQADLGIIATSLNAFLRKAPPNNTNEVCNWSDCPCVPGWQGAECDSLTPPVIPSSSSSSTGAAGGGGDCSCDNKPYKFQLQLLKGYKVQWNIARLDGTSATSTPTSSGSTGGDVSGSTGTASSNPYDPYSGGYRRLLGSATESPLAITLTLSGYDIQPSFGGFLGFGFGTTMVDADVILCFLDGDSQPACYDCYTESFDPHPDETWEGGRQDLQNVTVTFGPDGLTTFTLTRLLNTGDPMDFIIPPPPASSTTDATGDDYRTNIIFSHGPSSNQGFIHHGYDNRGKGVLNFITGQAETQTDNQANARLLHGISMLATWLFLYPLGAFIARYLKAWQHWIHAHEVLQTCGSVGCVSFAVMALVNGSNQGRTLMTLHSFLGIIIASVLILQIVLGEFSKWRIGTSEAQWWHRPLAKFHKYVGLSLVTIGPWQVSLGIDQLWPDIAIARSLYWAAIGLLLSVFLTAESYRRINAFLHAKRTHAFLAAGEEDEGIESLHLRAGEHPASKMLTKLQVEGLPTFSWSDLSARIKSGSKLIVISGVVIDVRPFLGAHPGGRSILEDSLGTDSTQAFFGKDPEAPLTHSHSSFAWKRLRDMAVGILKPEGEQLVEFGHRASIDLTKGGGMDQQAQLRARHLNQLLTERRVQSKPLLGEAAHYRRYRIIGKVFLSKNVIKLTFEQVAGVHPRPFVWKEYFAHSSDDIRLRLEASANEEAAAVAEAPTFVSRALVGITNAIVGNQRARLDFGRRSSLRMSLPQSFSPTQNNNSNNQHNPSAMSRWNMVKKESMTPRKVASSPLNDEEPQEADFSPQQPRDVRVASVEMTVASSPDRNGLASKPPTPPTTHASHAAVHPDPDNLADSQAQQQLQSRVSTIVTAKPALTNSMRQRSVARGGEGLANVALATMAAKSRSHFLAPGEHIELQVLVNAEAVERPYTPVPVIPGPDGVSDTLELLIRIYPKGTMTQFLSKRDVGDYVKMRGPLGRNLLNKATTSGIWPRVLMLAGGAGITPMLGLIHHHLSVNTRVPVKEARSQLVLMVFDRTSADIIQQDDLRQLAAASDGCLTVHHVLTEQKDVGPMSAEQGGRFRGRIDAAMMKEVLTKMGAIAASPSTAASVVSSGDIQPFTADQASPRAPQRISARGDKSERNGGTDKLMIPPLTFNPSPSQSVGNTPPDSFREPMVAATHVPSDDFPSTESPPNEQKEVTTPPAAPAGELPRLPAQARLDSATDPIKPREVITPRVFICGPLDFDRAALGALDDNGFNMEQVDVL